MASLDKFNPLAAETAENPYEFRRALREEAPVYQVPGAGFFIVSRYEDVMYMLCNEDVFSSKIPPGRQEEPTPEINEILAQGYPAANTLLTNDPPSHTRFRALVNRAFSARRVATMATPVKTIANELIDRFAGDGRVELVNQFAVGLPLTVIADALGVQRADMDKFKRWSDDAVAPLGGMISYERRVECAHSLVEFQHYFAVQLHERRHEPRDDILTDLINARLYGVESLDTAEMLNILLQLLVAGNETTTNLIASGMMLLLKNPPQMASLASDASLIPNFIEESLRMESPVQQLFRQATIDTEIGGVKIPAGSIVAACYASANRDDAQFHDADSFNPRRDNARTHLAFGQGVHFCLGAALARLEARIAFELLLVRLKNIRLAPKLNDFRHVPSLILRGLRELHIEFDAEPVTK